MNRQQMRNLVYECLIPHLRDRDFTLRRSEEGFVRSIRGGHQIIGVPLYDHDPVFEFSFTACIRIDEVERIFHLFSHSPPRYQSLTYTSMTLLDYFMPGDSTLFRVTRREDITDTITRLSPLVRDKIIPFFDKHQDARAISQAMNHDPLPIDRSLHPSRAMHAVILAHLSMDKDLDRLVARYREEVSQLPRGEQDKFDNLVRYLREDK